MLQKAIERPGPSLLSTNNGSQPLLAKKLEAAPARLVSSGQKLPLFAPGIESANQMRQHDEPFHLLRQNEPILCSTVGNKKQSTRQTIL
jgi:hypothetical protein